MGLKKARVFVLGRLFESDLKFVGTDRTLTESKMPGKEL